MEVRRSRFVCVTLIVLMGACVRPSSAGDVPPASAELAAVLAKWKAAVAELERYEIHGQRIVYNSVFEVEKLTNIVIQYEAPQSIRFEMRPLDVPKDAKSKRENPRTGRPYRIESEEPHLKILRDGACLSCIPGTGHLIAPPSNKIPQTPDAEAPPPPALPQPLSSEDVLSDGQLIPEKIELADGWVGALQRALIQMHFPQQSLPTLFAVDAPNFLDQNEWLVSHQSDGSIRLDGAPKSASLRGSYRQISILLDPVTGRPKAQKMIDPSGNLETVYIFEKWNLHPRSSSFKVDLRQYDYEVFAIPPELSPLEHRRRKVEPQSSFYLHVLWMALQF